MRRKKARRTSDPRSIIDDLATEETVILTGFDSAIIGVASRFGDAGTIVLYDKTKIIQNLRGQGMTLDEAQEFYDYNIIGSYIGEGTPVFAELISDLE